MPERDKHDPDDAPIPTPRVSGELLAEPAPSSNTRAARETETETELEPEPAASQPSDTLLSAGAPANPMEVLLEDRMLAVDQRLRELDARLSRLEQRRPVSPEQTRPRPWIWLVFLVALAAVFQLLRLAR